MFCYRGRINVPILLMAEYQELVNKLRMCRSDLDENTIITEVQKMVSSTTVSVHQTLRFCIELAMEGSIMPWEN